MDFLNRKERRVENLFGKQFVEDGFRELFEFAVGKVLREQNESVPNHGMRRDNAVLIQGRRSFFPFRLIR
jgi:hypothetical protein